MKTLCTIVVGCALLLVVVLRPSQPVFAADLVTSDLSSYSTTPDSLAQTLVGSGVTISNVSYTGASAAAGTFSGGTGIIGFESGIILSTGCVSNVIGPNNSPSATCQNGTAGDDQLTALAGVQTYDASILQFDFVPTADKVYFSYVFASEEYNEYVNQGFNDTFAFYINGVNCAVLPDNSPVNINSVNLTKNSDLYINNDIASGAHLNTQMDGLTKVLTCQASVTPHATNHIKLAIADAGDNRYDSNVFLQAGSFSTTAPAPTTTATATNADKSTYDLTTSPWTKQDVTVHLTATDTGGPGVKEIHAKVNGGADQVTSGSSADVSVSTEGTNTVSYYAVDTTGGTETAHTATIKLDKTAPTITATAKAGGNPYTAGTWTNQDVVVHISCSDSGSGLAAGSPPADATVSTEGSGQSVSGTCTDLAGNSSSITFNNIQIDKTKPSLSGTPTTSANGAGWYKGNVTIHWTCNDVGTSQSGIPSGNCPANSTITGEGRGLTSGPFTVTDAAGNVSPPTSSSAVNIDRSAPSASASATTADNSSYSSGTLTSQNVSVALSATDPALADLSPGSGVASITYSINSGTPTTTNASSVNIPTFTVAGTYSIGYFATDNAGNQSSPLTFTVNIDRAPPTTAATAKNSDNTTYDLTTSPWTKQSVTVTLTPTDFSGAGIDSTNYAVDCASPPTCTYTQGTSVSLSTDGTHTVTFYSKDKAGKSETAHTVTVKIDKTSPSLSCGTADGNWHTSDVSIHCTASDNGSGLASSADASFNLTTSVPINTASSNASTNSHQVCDAAGNCATAGPITGNKVDKTSPIVGCANADGNWHGSDVSIACTATDTGSGLANSADAAFSLTTSVSSGTENANASTNSHQVCDVAGNCTTAGPISGNMVDKKVPTVSCGSADGAWHNSDVSIACTASDGGSGLASSADASFSLTTSVSSGTENNNASTGSHQVCDAVHNCVTAGPVTGNKVDKKAPVISCGSADANWHTVDVSIACTASDSGSGLADSGDASFNLTTSVPAGTETNNASTNSHQVCDVANNCVTAGPITGNKIDKKGPLISCGSADANWHSADVSIACTASDSGSGLATVGDASFSLTTSVSTGTENNNASTNTHQVCDVAGNCATAGPISGNKVDKKAPTISCGTADANWHPSDVTIHCTAGDGGSGLANSVDASFNLTTSVAANTASSNAATGTHQVCDAAGNCATAGPISGNRVDKTFPLIGCGNPDSNWHGSDVTITCTASDSGSGLANGADASFSLTTSIPNGTETSNASTGSHQVCDVAGNCSTAGPISGIKVDKKAPAVSCGTADSNWHKADVTIPCTANDGGSGLVNAGDSSFNLTTSVPANTENNNASTNSHQVCDALGHCTTAGPISGNHVDKKAPSISASATIDTVAGVAYTAGTWTSHNVVVSFTCSDSGSGLASGSPPSPTTVSSEGANQSVSGNCYDKAGNQASASFTGINIDKTPPTITITGVADKGSYLNTATPVITITDTASGTSAVKGSGITSSGIKSQSITEDTHPYTSGTAVTTLGFHTLTVTVTDNAGNTASKSVTFLIFAYPATGPFVLGDGAVSTALAASTPPSMTFWSPIWARLNPLVNTPLALAPSTFKGWVNSTSPTPPSCGGTWTGPVSYTTGAPASVPSYMGVMVSSSITLANNKLVGDIKRIVILKTDAGYSNAQGRTGTGTIVATHCGP